MRKAEMGGKEHQVVLVDVEHEKGQVQDLEVQVARSTAQKMVFEKFKAESMELAKKLEIEGEAAATSRATSSGAPRVRYRRVRNPNGIAELSRSAGMIGINGFMLGAAFAFTRQHGLDGRLFNCDSRSDAG
jgi:hypothetical protein